MDLRNAKSTSDQYIKIKGSEGETEEIQCLADFNVINQDVVCTFTSDVSVGEYKCLSLRTGGFDGLDISKV